MTLDGYIDDTTNNRLILSSPEDRSAVDRLRADVDAILVGAETLRKDDPSLRVRDQQLIESRSARGMSAQPMRVVLTRSAVLPRSARFFADDDGADRVVFVAGTGGRPDVDAEILNIELPDGCASTRTFLERVLATLVSRQVKTVLVEGGGRTASSFLAEGLVDRLRIAIAPRVLGEAAAPRFIPGAPSLPARPHERGFRVTSAYLLGEMFVVEACLAADAVSGSEG